MHNVNLERYCHHPLTLTMEQAPVNLEKHRTRDEDVHAVVSRPESDGTHSSTEKAEDSYTTSSGSQTPVAKPLASRTKPYEGASAGPITEALAHHLHVRRRRVADLDDVATQESVFDGELAEHYTPNDAWEVSAAQRLGWRCDVVQSG
jgi:hypothetical protein